ncbi:Arm domain-containing protein, partial [Cephalotus follicularis]
MGHDSQEGDEVTKTTTTTKEDEYNTWNKHHHHHHKNQTLIVELSDKLINGDLRTKIEAARDIRKVVRKSSVKTRSKFAAAGVIQPLVFMLRSPNLDARQSSLLALLNLAVRNERNKVKIVTAGAIPPLVELLKFQDGSFRELAAAAILTLSAAAPNKATIIASGAAPLLVDILGSGSVQGKVDAVTTLHNLSTLQENSHPILNAKAVFPLIELLKECRKHSKFAEKATALLEILSNSEEGRIAITHSDGGILTLVETIEDGSLVSTEHAVGALLSLCQSSRDKYRALILKEGAIPGLLWLTVDGTPEAQERARMLLDLLRDTPKEKKLAASVLEKIVYDIATRVDGADKAAETAKRLLQDVVQRSMELSLNHLQTSQVDYPHWDPFSPKQIPYSLIITHFVPFLTKHTKSKTFEKLYLLSFGFITMLGRSMLSRTGSFRPENLGQNALAMIGNLCFTLFVLGVLIFTIIAATYQPEDPLFHPSTKITTFLTSTSNATFKSDITVVKTGEDFMASNQTAFATFINITDVENQSGASPEDSSSTNCEASVDSPIDCKDPEVFHLMMKKTIEHFKDIHFYRPKEGKAAAFYKDYRRFVIVRSENCTTSVVSIGDYHSGMNARKKKKNQKPGFEKATSKQDLGMTLPVVGETVNDALPVVESEKSFSDGKYLIYMGGGDRCKSMNHYLWSFLCALGEAQYLNRTLVMDLTLCLSSIYTSSGQDEEGKDFRFYFDFEHLTESASVLDKDQFWLDWNKWQKKDGLSLNLVEDFRVTPMKLAEVKDALIMRKFGSVEPDNYWYRVCEGETESVVQRPWHLLWKSRRMMDIVSAIATRLNWDYDSVHIERGEKAKNKDLWPNLEADTSPDALLSTLGNKIEDGRNLYVATNEPPSFFDPLKDKYSTHFLDEYKDLWNENSEWYLETMKLNKGLPVEFDGYMRVSIDTEVFLRGKKQIETFNDLTNDCKDGINTCKAVAS